MTTPNLRDLKAERAYVAAQYESTPATALLTRASLQSRLRKLDTLIEGDIRESRPVVKLTFNGRPVVRTHGILADFGLKAVGAFNDAVSAVAASLSAPLAAMGPIPNRSQNQLLITGTAIGSFGFELEEYGNGQLPLEGESPVALAMERTRALLASSVSEDDEGLAEAAADLDRRALEKVRTFVHTLAENEAICAIEYRGQRFRFSSVGQVAEAAARLDNTNISEREIRVRGFFEGVIPANRTFQFKLESGDVIVGKISRAVIDPYEINNHLRTSAEVLLSETRIGNGRPRYVLADVPWSNFLPSSE